MILNLKFFIAVYILLIGIVSACSYVAQSFLSASWVLLGGIFFLLMILSLSFITKMLLTPHSSLSNGLAIILLLGKLPVIVLLCYMASSAGFASAASFTIGVTLFIPALLISSLIRHVKSAS